MGYKRLGKWIDWQAMKHGSPLAIVDPRGTSSECPQCNAEMIENEYRKLRCPSCGFEAGRDVVRKLNIRKRALKILGISGGTLTPSPPPQMTNEVRIDGGTDEPPVRGLGNPHPFKAGRRSDLICGGGFALIF